MEALQTFLLYLIVFVMGIIVGVDMFSILPHTEEESIEYITDDIEIFYVNGGRELIHDVAQVEVGTEFILMFGMQNNIKAIIPNREVEHIKVLERT